MGRRNDDVSATSGLHFPLIESFDKPKTNRFSFLCAIVASMCAVLLGYDIGVMSGAAIYIQEDFQISDVEVEILVGIISLYATIGAAAAGKTSDSIGRRYTMALSAGFFFVGAILMGFAPNYSLLMSGRFVAGIGIGYASAIASVYTAEISPASSRGCLSSFPEVFVNVGILLGYISNYAFSKLPVQLGWRFMLGIGLIPSVFLAVVVILVTPESPRWLVMQGRLAEAKQVLIRTSDSIEESLQRLDDIKNAVGIPANCEDDVVQIPKQSSKSDDVWKEFFLHPTPAVRHILITVIGVHFFQEASGMNAVVLYSPRIFAKAGISSSDHKLLATVAVGVTKTVFILVATVLFDRVGRRPLILTSIGGMIISLITLGVGLTIIERSHEQDTWVVGFCVAMVLTVVAFFSTGIGPMTYVSSELFPLKLRAQGVSMGMVVNTMMGGVVSMTFLSLYNAITIGGTFFLFAGIAMVGWVFFYVIFPETRGKNLEQVEGLFGNLLWKFSVKKADTSDDVENSGNE
ncbi:polyol transporter 5-like [Benincasa hispida]|uniref:polyol transporter 5-like n=1 Tax=Benincasa hispida TaxID=102211 RepID=UPI0018FFD371|nr:polyol transporter 5-like [Benincasa hispida]XP_038887478.1 polyol transporter 5-like [Benincasa hispida]